MKLRKAFALMLAAVTAAGILSGCGSSKIGDYATTQVAKYGSETIYLEEANFWLRYQQITNEAYYGQMYKYFGYDNMWTMPDGNDGKTMADTVHTSVMSQLLQMRVLRDHAADYNVELTEDQKAKCKEAAGFIFEDYPNFAEYSDADTDKIASYMELNSTAVLVANAIKAETEIDIPEDSVAAYGIEYITVTAPQEETAEADEETEAAAETEAAETEAAEEPAGPEGEELAKEVLKKAQSGTSLQDIAAENDSLSVQTADYLLTGETSTDDKYLKTIGMAAGDVDMISADNSWTIVTRVNDKDDAATETRRQNAENEQRTEHFNAVYTDLAKAAPKFKVNEKIWEQIKITDMIYEAPEAETQAAVEAAPETEAAEETAAAEETTAAAEETTAAAEETTAAAEETAAAETTAAAEETTAAVEETTAAE
ncbi:MAG: hypothetical protein IJJ25_01080 [Lachnospiraceae bacterium]|nr:hypothetical protein [Lachnospiraceae bacterium]